MSVSRDMQNGVVVWILLFMLSTAMLLTLSNVLSARNPKQQARLQTLTMLANAEQALLAYAMQPLGTTQCALNCPRPGDLPCPDRNNDGVAESSCSGVGTRLGRLPWKTLGLGDVRDASGERLWYAVSEAYKNNPRVLPLNTEAPGSWYVLNAEFPALDIPQVQAVVAVLIAPMQPLTRSDGWLQQRKPQQSDIAKNYLDMAATLDNAGAIEASTLGFVAAQPSGNFNDIVWPVTATRMHRAMQQQVMFELKRALNCNASSCSILPTPAEITDSACLGKSSLSAGSCLSSASSIGRFPLDYQAHWPLAAQHILDGDATHHWFQQNGWREQVFYWPHAGGAQLVVAGEPLPGQSRQTAAEKSVLAHYVEAATFQSLAPGTVALSTAVANDSIDTVIAP
ncbi:hypothetical protein [Methylophilus aquaticus]|uniref:Uncharacterized protein n=1 Tax=Methylophilus aquaticus TaxID=1971610 RepID=A0ABT9JTN3_9PROT|nr:hypothetical protein [Methylophilus aquaticus]MDP8567860.1 hypothetical protein [Methylophilus aquaticus]